MRVRAVKLGFDNFVRRRPGVEFEIPDASLISLNWMEPVDEEAVAAFEAKEAEQAKLAAETNKKFKGPAALRKEREAAKKEHQKRMKVAQASSEMALSQLHK